MRLPLIALLCASLLALPLAARETNAELRKQVIDAERGFAAAMKQRDYDGFMHFISDEAVFFSGATPLRGKAAIGRAWKRHFDKPQAPFSWAPEQVEVVDSGTLAYSGGPVHGAAGKPISRFNAIWRLEAPRTWRIVFERLCESGD
jgi:ketosteroid isomerase-like protein